MSFHLFAVLVIALFPLVAFSEPSNKHPTHCHAAYPGDATFEWLCRTLRSGEPLEKLLGERWVEVARFNRLDRRHARVGVSFKAPRRVEVLESFTPLPLFYPPDEQDKQFILINLSEQFLGAYEYGALRFALPIASGNGETEPPPSANSASWRRTAPISRASTPSKRQTGPIP